MSHSNSSATYLYVAAAAIVIILLVVVSNRQAAPSKYKDFAQCLTDKGVKMYGAWWCPHCGDQKAKFEGAFRQVHYVECSQPGSQAMNQTCKEAKIDGYPTWEFSDGSRISGVQELETLAQKSGCELPAE